MGKIFNPTQKKILQHFLTNFPEVTDAINRKDFQKVYSLAPKIIGKYNTYLVSELLMQYGINPVEKLGYVPANFLSHAFDGTFSKIDLSAASRIDPEAFAESGIKEVIGGDNIHLIDGGAFYDSKLIMANFKNVDNLGQSAFAYCRSLKELPIKDSHQLVTIPQYCFEKCESLDEINIPNSVKVIEDLAFAYCGILKKVYIPAGIEDISPSAFRSCLIRELHFQAGETRFKEMKKINPKLFYGTEIEKVFY